MNKWLKLNVVHDGLARSWKSKSITMVLTVVKLALACEWLANWYVFGVQWVALWRFMALLKLLILWTWPVLSAVFESAKKSWESSPNESCKMKRRAWVTNSAVTSDVNVRKKTPSLKRESALKLISKIVDDTVTVHFGRECLFWEKGHTKINLKSLNFFTTSGYTVSTIRHQTISKRVFAKTLFSSFIIFELNCRWPPNLTQLSFFNTYFLKFTHVPSCVEDKRWMWRPLVGLRLKWSCHRDHSKSLRGRLIAWQRVFDDQTQSQSTYWVQHWYFLQFEYVEQNICRSRYLTRAVDTGSVTRDCNHSCPADQKLPT